MPSSRWRTVEEEKRGAYGARPRGGGGRGLAGARSQLAHLQFRLSFRPLAALGVPCPSGIAWWVPEIPARPLLQSGREMKTSFSLVIKSLN